jgi:hypothetical protein
MRVPLEITFGKFPSVLKDFPLGDHDDGPDALEQALRLLID